MSDYSPIRSWLHRRGIARLVNCSHRNGRVTSVYVETALPLKLLAYYAAHDPLARLHHGRIVGHHHVGLLRRRWTLKP
jgi:hypothetical protein